MDKEDIKKQAKKIIDNFAKAIENVKFEEELVERDSDRREEKEASEPDAEFRKIVLENFRIKDSDSARKSEKDFRHAPDTKDGCIVAEKGKWAK